MLNKIVAMPDWWYSPDDDGPDGPDPCAYCSGEDPEGQCECPVCDCGEPVTNGEDHRRCHMIDDY